VLADGALEAWRRQYRRSLTPNDGGMAKAVEARLEALGSSPKPDDVDAAIGNGSWTHPSCARCDRYFALGVEVENMDSEGGAVCICDACVHEMAALLVDTGSLCKHLEQGPCVLCGEEGREHDEAMSALVDTTSPRA
jgi:hypothetical protein